MLLPKSSSSVYTPCFKSVALSVCLVKVPFQAFFGPDKKRKNGCGHIHILEIFLRLC